MKPFWKCIIVIKTLVRTKLKFYPFWKNWCLISIFGPVFPKSKHPHKFPFLNFIMLNETILEMRYCQINFGKNRQVGGVITDFHIWAYWPRIKKRSLIETLWSSWSVKYLVGFLLPRRNRLWQETLYKFFCKISYLCILGQKGNCSHNLILHVGHSIYYFLGFQNRNIFVKMLFTRTFNHVVCNNFNIRD